MESSTKVNMEGSTDIFEGPEKTLTLSFRSRKVEAGSLRRIPREAWEDVLQHARCQILSVVDSTPVDTTSRPQTSKKDCILGEEMGCRVKRRSVHTKGVTGYLLSESSLFVSDTSLSLKTCGQTTPLAALEPLLDLAVPSWRTKHPGDYVKFVSFTRLGYMFPEQQVSPHTSWDEEVKHLEQHFDGEYVVLGSPTVSTSHVYVANYLPKDEITDVFSTQVSLTSLSPESSMVRFVGDKAPDKTPLRTSWEKLHGGGPRSISARAKLDECFFEPIGYSANAVFGHHFTTIHATPQASCSYISVETSLPLDGEGRRHFAGGAQGLCEANCINMTEFALTSKLFRGGTAPEIPGFQMTQSSQTVGKLFACSHHHYVRALLVAPSPLRCPQSPCVSYASEQDIEGACGFLLPPSEEEVKVPQIVVGDIGDAPLRAAEQCLMKEVSGPGVGDDSAALALIDLGALRRRAALWRQHLPRVEPFYAVKCNPHPAIVGALWDTWQNWGLGGFDCASPDEMDIAANCGVNLKERVVYANPCKQATALNFARKAGVMWVVFDNMAELDKVKHIYPSAQLILRVQTDDALAQCPLSNKFGAAMDQCGNLLARARELGLQVIGVSFHVGSGCSQRGAFRSALHRARAAFDEGAQLGFDMRLLDIGGGFPGWDEEGQATFVDHALDIEALLAELFPSPQVRVIAEPGRFFAATSQALLVNIISVADTPQGFRYYLNDGLYGSFNCLLYDHASLPAPTVLRGGLELPDSDAGPEFPCTLFGPTCDGFDVLAQNMMLPRLRPGDRLLFRDMGAYTSAAASRFNGFSTAQSLTYESRLRA